MARPVWTGSISFGLVNVPVKLYSAKSERPVRFNQLDGRNGARIRQKRVNEVTGEEVEFGDIVKGYEISKGNYVTITDEELAALGTEATHRLDLECFVDLDEIDPIYFDGAYLVAPADATKPYALLVRAMEESNRVGIARFVMRAKEHVAVLRPLDGALVMSMMVYADELAQREQFTEFDGLADVEVSDKELTMAESLIDALSEPFLPEQYHDTYRSRVMELIEQKAEGLVLRAAEAPAAASANVIDLMDALQASVEASRAARTRHPTALAPAAADEADEAAPAAKRPAPAKKTPAKKATAKKAATSTPPAAKTPSKRRTA